MKVTEILCVLYVVVHFDSGHRIYSDYNSNDSNAIIGAYYEHQSTFGATEQP